jgi:hypothetical protein
MCTYNGEKFLPQQLASMLRQTRLPDEVILRDDGSTDSTPAILQAFQASAPFPVDFQVNEHNLGSTRNFEAAMRACRCDLIALSDQDDLWHPRRLGRSEQELLQHPEAGLVFTDGDVIDDAGKPLGFSLWENFNFTRNSIDALQSGDTMPLARRTFVTGATVMLRARLVPLCLPTGNHWLHDGWLAMLIASLADIRPIDERLIAYRMHAAQQVGLGPDERPDLLRKDVLQQQAASQAVVLTGFRDALDEICAAIEHLPLTPAQRTQGAADAFRRHRDFVALRLSLPQNRLARVPILLNAIDQYRASSMGLLSMLKDLVLPHPPR